MSRTWTITARIFVSPPGVRGCSSMVEPLPSKQITRVRFPSSAPVLGKPRATRPGAFALPDRSRGLGERGGVDDVAVEQTLTVKTANAHRSEPRAAFPRIFSASQCRTQATGSPATRAQ